MKSLLNALWILLVAAVSAVLMLVPLSQAVANLANQVVTLIQREMLFAGIFALLFVLSLLMLVMQFSGSKKDALPRSVLLPSEEGEVRVSLGAIDTLVKQSAGQVKGVKEIKTSFSKLEAGLGIQIRAVVSADQSIPELSSQVQKDVREHVLNIAGVDIDEVKVMVETVATSGRGRSGLR